jgi:hypothetical protein
VIGTLRANAPLRRLLAAWAQSCIGTGAGYVALLLLTLGHLHTAWAVGAVLLADYLPSIAFGAWFGALADRHSKRRLLVVASLLQAVAYGGLAMAHTAVPIVGLALLAGAGTALERPTVRAALPVLAGEGSQVAAAMYDTMRWVGMTVGPLVAAALFAVGGIALPLALNGVSFAIAAAVMATVAIGPAVHHDSLEPPDTSVRAGISAAIARPAIAIVVASTAGTFIAGGLLNVCEPFLAKNVLGGSSSDYALLVASYCAGMVAASVVVARRGTKPPGVLLGRYVAAVLLTAAGMGGSALVGSVLLAGLTFAATGVGNALLVVSGTQLILACVPNVVQGRLFGAKDTVEGACFLIGLAGAGGLVAAVGIRVTLGSAGAICALCGLAAALALRSTSVDIPALIATAAGGPTANASDALEPSG